MTVKELKERLEKADDDAVMCVENRVLYGGGLYSVKSAVQCDRKLLVIEADYGEKVEVE